MDWNLLSALFVMAIFLWLYVDLQYRLHQAQDRILQIERRIPKLEARPTYPKELHALVVCLKEILLKSSQEFANAMRSGDVA